MSKDVIMPQMGESLAEGTITKWLKKVGDKIERDEPLFEISTDKVDAEIPAPASGTLSEIVAGEGQTVAVNAVVARIAGEGEAALPAAPPAPAEPKAAPKAEAPAPKPAPAQKPEAAPVATREPEAPRPSAPRGDGRTTLEKPYGQYTVEEVRRVRSSPVVRKIAAEHGVDIAEVPGHGISGRVTKQDILDYIETAPSPAPSPRTAPAPAAAPPPAMPAAPPMPAGGLFIPDLRIPPYVEGEPVEVEPMTIMRKKIAEHMVYSMSVAAHVTSFFDVDFEAVARQRESMKRDMAEKGIKLTFMPFVVRAVVEGLKKYPYVNAAVMGDKIVFKKEINVGIAVALEDGKGLIVPVIRNADEKNLQGLARAINDLGERARTKKLMPDDVLRGTFSITNPGVFGGLMGTPIINQPQVAILGVGAIEKRPVVVNDAIAIRHRAYLSLSYDHRLVDGAMAEMFMASVKQFIEAGNVQ
jgi:pyruvate dehydrogenase E2 component (dihydrolipoyllysine-residue acetyltransferase)